MMKNILPIMKNLKSSFKFNFIKTSKINFSTISLITREGTVDRSANPNFDQNINWELAKIWITPHYNSFWNSLKNNQSFQNDTAETCKVVAVGPLISQLDFDRFTRKMGLTLSRDENVYIEDGIYNGKKVRVVSSNKEDASNASNLFKEKNDFVNSDVNILYLTDSNELGSKRFVFYDKKAKIIISNTKNLQNLTKAIDEVSQ